MLNLLHRQLSLTSGETTTAATIDDITYDKERGTAHLWIHTADGQEIDLAIHMWEHRPLEITLASPDGALLLAQIGYNPHNAAAKITLDLLTLLEDYEDGQPHGNLTPDTP